MLRWTFKRLFSLWKYRLNNINLQCEWLSLFSPKYLLFSSLEKLCHVCTNDETKSEFTKEWYAFRWSLLVAYNHDSEIWPMISPLIIGWLLHGCSKLQTYKVILASRTTFVLIFPSFLTLLIIVVIKDCTISISWIMYACYRFLLYVFNSVNIINLYVYSTEG